MIEVFGCFPTFHVVAFSALVAELTFVWIVVAGLTNRRKAEIGFGEILILDQSAVCGNHVGRRVALLTRKRRVLPLKIVAREAVVKFSPRWLPVNDIVILPVVLQVAPNAVLPVRVLHLKSRVIPMVSRKSLRDFFVTFQAFKDRCTRPKRMAGRTLSRPA